VILIVGFIGKITLQIPLRHLRSEPWVISIEKLYLVAGPYKHTQVRLSKAIVKDDICQPFMSGVN
jgi:vacuolar protein sorting-associated protein 13D